MHSGLGSIPFARRYLGYRVFFLFLRLLRCFSSAGLLRTAMYSPHGDAGFLHRVSPFGHLRIKGYMPLPEAFRSLLRPSSALIAKASALRPLCLTFRSHLSMIAFIYTELINCSCLMSLTFAFTLGLFWNHLCIQFSGYVKLNFRRTASDLSSAFLSGLHQAVGLSRLELPTSRLSGVRSNRLSYKPIFSDVCFRGAFFLPSPYSHLRGDEEIRTLDPLLARQVLSQLSYVPVGPALTDSRAAFPSPLQVQESLSRYSFLMPAAAWPPGPSPAQYFRPLMS